jgi:hypothetical protein
MRMRLSLGIDARDTPAVRIHPAIGRDLARTLLTVFTGILGAEPFAGTNSITEA